MNKYAVILVFALVPMAFAVDHVPLDDFESYADQTALLAAWPKTGATSEPVLTADGTAYSGTKHLYCIGDSTTTSYIEKTVDFDLPAAGWTITTMWRSHGTANGRFHVAALNANVPAQFFAVGCQTNGYTTYSARMLTPSPNPNWRQFGTFAGQNVWVKLDLFVEPNRATAYLNGVQSGQWDHGGITSNITMVRIGHTYDCTTPTSIDDVGVLEGNTPVSDWYLY